MTFASFDVIYFFMIHYHVELSAEIYEKLSGGAVVFREVLEGCEKGSSDVHFSSLNLPFFVPRRSSRL